MFTVLSAALLLIVVVPLAAAAATPTLKVTSSRLVATGASVSIDVKIQHFAPACCSFDTFDIRIAVDPNVLMPQTITLGPKVASWTVFTNCVNGVGTGCDLDDTTGVAHMAATSSSGVPVYSHGPTPLFTITYSAVNGAPSTAITATQVMILHAGTAINPTIVNGFYG